MNALLAAALVLSVVCQALAAPTNTTTSSLPVDSLAESTAATPVQFTCFEKAIGYYADTNKDCKIYHFCLLGDYNGETVYQRISYLCLNNTRFDQQALDCVEPAKLTAPCVDSPKYYNTSNEILRQAIINQSSVADKSSTTTTSSSTTPSPSTASETEATSTTTTAAPESSTTEAVASS